MPQTDRNERAALIAWRGDIVIPCPKCARPFDVDIDVVEIDEAEVRLLFICRAFGCGHTWWLAVPLPEGSRPNRLVRAIPTAMPRGKDKNDVIGYG